MGHPVYLYIYIYR